MTHTVVGILLQYKEGLAKGLLVTLALCAIVWSVGLIVGMLFGVTAHRSKVTAGRGLETVSFLLTSIPFLVLLYWLHYPLQELLRVVVSPFVTAAAALSLLNIVLVASIIRNVLSEFPHQYIVAGRVCGLTNREILRHIEFPIILRGTLPQLLSVQVQMLQMTVFASLITVNELFRVAQHINSTIYKPIEIYTTLALFFIAICLPLNLLAAYLKKRYTRNISEK